MKFKQENHRLVVRRPSNHRNQLSIGSNQLSLSRYSRRSKPLMNAIVVFVTITFDPLSSINSVELVDHLLHSYICSIDMIIIHNQNQKAIATDTKRWERHPPQIALINHTLYKNRPQLYNFDHLDCSTMPSFSQQPIVTTS